MTNPLDQPMPTRGPDPDAALAEEAGGRRVGRVTVALGTLAVLAVGVLAGMLIRGAGSDDAAAAGPGAGAGGAASGYAAAAGGAEGGGMGGFPGGGGQASDATSGTVSALTGTGFTLTAEDGTTVQVTIAADTAVTISATGTTTGALADGDTVSVQGTETDGTIAATVVREGGFAGGQRPAG